MFKVTEKGRMILTRGDTATFSIDLYNEDGTPYVPEEGDLVLFSLKKNLYDADFILQKEGLLITIQSEDTRELELDTYYYDIKVIFENGEVQTVFPTNLFQIVSNVGDWDE